MFVCWDVVGLEAQQPPQCNAIGCITKSSIDAVQIKDITCQSGLNVEQCRSETGRIRFRRVRFRTPNSVSFLGLTVGSGERTQWAPLSLLFVCQSELTEFSPELTEFALKLSEAQWVLSSETVLSKQYSARFLVDMVTAWLSWFGFDVW